MTKKQHPPISVADGVWWLGSSESESFLQVNAYFLYREGIGIIFDPGPVGCFREIHAAAMSLAPMRDIVAIVVSHQDPDVCASIPLWENAGFTGTVIAHWRTYLLLPSYGLRSKLRSVKDMLGESEQNLLGVRFLSLPYLHAPGTIGMFDGTTGTFFSGDLFGAVGKNAELIAEESYLTRMVNFHEQYMPSSAMLVSALDRLSLMNIERICPQHGSIIEGLVTKAIAILRTAKCGKLDNAVADEEFLAMVEMDSLRKKSFMLQEDLVLSEDERLRDPLTGLYTLEYLEGYTPVFFENRKNGALAYLRLDQMKAYNNEFGFAAGNEAIQSFVRIVMETRKEDVMMFRVTGPAVVLCLPEDDGAIEEVIRLQKAVARSEMFKKDLSVSCAISYRSEASSADELMQLVRERSRLIDGMGPGSVCDSSPVDGESRVGQMVIVESDNSLRTFLESYFTTRRYGVISVRDGSEALNVIESANPVLVVCEMSVPQYDAFQIREKMMENASLAHIPFILISHVKDERSVIRAMGIGIRHFLKKPLMMAELEGLVRQLWEDSDVSR